MKELNIKLSHADHLDDFRDLSAKEVRLRISETSDLFCKFSANRRGLGTIRHEIFHRDVLDRVEREWNFTFRWASWHDWGLNKTPGIVRRGIYKDILPTLHLWWQTSDETIEYQARAVRGLLMHFALGFHDFEIPCEPIDLHPRETEFVSVKYRHLLGYSIWNPSPPLRLSNVPHRKTGVRCQKIYQSDYSRWRNESTDIESSTSTSCFFLQVAVYLFLHSRLRLQPPIVQ